MSSTSPPPHVLVPCALSTFGLGEFRLKLRIVLVQLSIIRQSLHVTHPLAPLCSHVLKICRRRGMWVVSEKKCCDRKGRTRPGHPTHLSPWSRVFGTQPRCPVRPASGNLMRREPDGNVGWPAAVRACKQNRPAGRRAGRQAGRPLLLLPCDLFFSPCSCLALPLLFSTTNPCELQTYTHTHIQYRAPQRSCAPVLWPRRPCFGRGADKSCKL